MKREKLFCSLFVVLVCSMLTTEGLLVLQGRWREAIPLHLCSISAIAASMLARFRSLFLLDFLWYLGMPGAALALLFPAPASSLCQPLFNLSYFITHAMILLIPALRIRFGMHPRMGKTRWMMLVLACMAGIADAANRALGTDFLFLASPPPDTPLEAVFVLGKLPYRAALLMLMFLLSLMMETAAGKLWGETA